MKPNTTEIKVPCHYQGRVEETDEYIYAIPNQQILKWAMPILKEIIKSRNPDFVSSDSEPPFRRDFIDKWDFLDYLEKEVNKNARRSNGGSPK